MNCEKMEMLLARYASGDLSDDEEFIVQVHLAACGGCRDSLEVYASLESALVSRTGERPSARAASRDIMKRLRREEPHGFVSSLWSAPVIIGTVVALSILLTIVLGLLLDDSPTASQGIPGLTGLERYFAGIPEWIAGVFGGETWLIFLVYGAVAVGFVGLGSLVMLRSVRE
jgi:hypothetical protein